MTDLGLHPMKTLLIDIETSPSLAYIWSLWDTTVSTKQLVSTTEMLCFSAKWMGESKTMFWSTHSDGKDMMVAAAHALLDEADVVVHYNGERFDVPHLNREFLLAGLRPPAPYRQMDLFRTMKRRFRFVSNKLEHISKELGLSGKVQHEGFDLWSKCLAGDNAAWRRMERYNRRDVKLLEELYGQLQPWIQQHPNRTLYDGTSGCPVCGGDNLQRRGFAITQASRFQRWHCEDCGAWLRSPSRDAGAEFHLAAA